MNKSKVIIFTSPNYDSFKQIQRMGATTLTVPSYSRDSSPSSTIRHIIASWRCSAAALLGVTLTTAEQLLKEANANTTVRNVLDIVQRKDVKVVSGVKGPYSLFSTSLAKEADKNDINSYLAENVAWNISSDHIMCLLVSIHRDALLPEPLPCFRRYQTAVGTSSPLLLD